jgi:hypothetical protein
VFSNIKWEFNKSAFIRFQCIKNPNPKKTWTMGGFFNQVDYAFKYTKTLETIIP